MATDDKYPFLEYINEDKSDYKKASDAGYVDPDNLFLIGDSGGFLMNIIPGMRFVNTHLFQEAATYFTNNKEKYCHYKEDSISHRQFRKREEYRRKKGFSAPCLLMPDGSIKNVRITGAHYNFLNYTRMEQLDETTIKRGNTNTAKKYYNFPKFIDAQFWTFHVMEFAENNGFHLIIDKTRRGGFSYIMASDSANRVNVQARKMVIHVAADKKFLTADKGLSDFAVSDLKFYEEKTPFVRGLYSTNKEDFRLGYKLTSGIEADNSWKSSLFSVSAMNNPDCAIGKDAVCVKVEELSTMDNFDEFMNVTEPAMRTGAYTTGILMAWGTATSGNMQVFEENFYNPKAFHFMPFENVWDKDSRNEVCGFFKSYAWGLQGEINGVKGVDKYGNSNMEVGLAIAFKERRERKENSKTYAEYINYLGQYALTPSESFSSATENIFSSEELTAWEDKLKNDELYKFYIDGMVIENAIGDVQFKSNDRLYKEKNKVYDYIIGVPRRANEDPHGCIRRWFAPEYDEVISEYGMKKEIPIGRYSISYDPVGIDKEGKDITSRHSHNSIKVWMNPDIKNGYKQKLVASYYGRPNSLEEADRICFMLAKYYNCIGTTCVEVNRGETVKNFRQWKATKYLARDPLFVWDSTIKGKVSTSYGYSIGGGSQRKLDALRLLKEFLYTDIGVDEYGNKIKNFHRIYDYQTILELKKWNPIGNFDRVSEMIVRGIEWKAMDIEAKKAMDIRKKIDVDDESENIMSRSWF